MISSFLPWRPEMLTLNICFLCNKNNVTARNLKGPQRWWMEPGVEEGGDKTCLTPNLRWKIQPLGSWQTLSIVRQEQHGRNRLRFKLWVMAFNLLRALLILKLQVATGKIARRGCSRGHFGGPRRQVGADDRYRRTPQDLQYSGAPTDRSSYKHSKHTTECSLIVFTPRSEKWQALGLCKKFLSTEIDLSSPYNNCHPRTGAICDFSQDLWSEDKAYWQ